MKWLTVHCVCFLSCFAQTSLNSTGVVSGKLTGEDGSAIAGARVGLLLQPPSSQGKAAQPFWAATSDVHGSFQFSRLNGGTYKICVEAPNTAWLNPCEWALGPPSASLSSAQPTASVNPVLKKGAAVLIRIDDPGNLLSQNEGKTPGAHLLVGVGTAAFSFHTAPIVSQDAAGRYQQVILPFNSTTSLVVRSSFFKLSDANGVSLPAGATIPITVPTGQVAPIIRLIVTGAGK